MSDKNAQSNNWLDQVTWNEQGLVAVIAQEFDTGDVLMMAWMNHESLQMTLEKAKLFIGRAQEKRSGTKVRNLATYKK